MLDTSDKAADVANRQYKSSGVPLNYIVDREGKIVDGWYGNDYARALRRIDALGAK